ncbi:hypothetical protein XH93_14200 [Bradyrhizobium sp. CCBAU 51753]|nr:hypothetical protein XH93_14200 [Bradyrhizobium sp. CCBAU 51753]
MVPAVMSATVVSAVMAMPVVMVAMVEMRAVMPAMMARPVAVTARLPIAAAPAVADLAHLADIGRFACDVAGLRQPVRHRGRGAGHQGCASERGQSNHSKLDVH